MAIPPYSSTASPIFEQQSTTSFDPNQFLKACEEGDEIFVQSNIANMKNINLPDEGGSTPLYHACANGNVTIVQLLLKADADVNLTNTYGFTPLYIASDKGRKEVVELLLKFRPRNTPGGIDLEIKDKSGNNALHRACSNGYASIVKLLIEAGAEKNEPNALQITPLCLACLGEKVEVVEILLKFNVDLTPFHRLGKSAFHEACSRNSEKIVELLIKAGADINLPDQSGNPPLEIACSKKEKAVVETLLKANPDLTLLNKFKRNALHAACGYRDEESAKLLINAGVPLDQQDHQGQTPLHIACERGTEEIALLLIEAGANPNIQNHENKTPLHLSFNKAIVTQRLIEKGSLLDPVDKLGCTPLHLACSTGFKEVARALIQGGSNIELPVSRQEMPADQNAPYIEQNYPSGATPLELASIQKHPDIVEMLLESGLRDLLSIDPSYPFTTKENEPELPSGAELLPPISSASSSSSSSSFNGIAG